MKTAKLLSVLAAISLAIVGATNSRAADDAKKPYARIRVIFTDGDGKPVPKTSVQFEPHFSTDFSVVSTPVLTDADQVFDENGNPVARLELSSTMITSNGQTWEYITPGNMWPQKMQHPTSDAAGRRERR